MSFFDRLKSKLGLAGGALALDRPPRGVLDLGLGDRVAHYRESWSVTGVRLLEGEGAKVWHYCLRDEQGVRAVLAAEEGPDPVKLLQRQVEGEVRWDADVLTEVDEEPFTVVQRGRMQARAWGDTGLRGSRFQLDYREYEDPDGDRVLVLEDYGGQREVRVGEPVHDAELELLRGEQASGGAGVPDAPGSGVRFADLPGYGGAGADVPAARVVKGSPMAAAMALSQAAEDLPVDPSDPAAGAEGASGARPADHDPTAYEDDDWADAYDDDAEPAEDGEATLSRGTAHAPLENEEEEWLSAAEFLSRSGGKWEDAA